jgi:DNA topoisomerase IA
LQLKVKKYLIATDPDREGEAIAQDIVDILNGSLNTKDL